MYAVIESGGKQYRVELGAEIQVDRLDVQPGDNINLERVLLVADGEATAVGRPLVDGALVSAEVLRQERGDKIVVFKYKPKARTRVKKGARAELTTLRIADIAFEGRSAAKDAKAADSEKAKAARGAEKVAAEKAAADQALAAQLTAAAAATPAPADAAPAAGGKARSPRKATMRTQESSPAPEGAAGASDDAQMAEDAVTEVEPATVDEGSEAAVATPDPVEASSTGDTEAADAAETADETRKDD